MDVLFLFCHIYPQRGLPSISSPHVSAKNVTYSHIVPYNNILSNAIMVTFLSYY